MQNRVGLGALAIGMTAFATYWSALKIQFYDGWWYMMWSATMDLPRFLIQFLDPAYITQGYRPVQGIYMYALYQLFGFNPDGYHLAHNLLHALNSILVFLLARRLAKQTRLAFVAGMIYAVLPNYSLAIFWHAVVDPLAGLFYLLALWWWVQYLETKRTRDYIATWLAFVLALLSKEVAIFIPFFMFLIAWWFYRERPAWRIDVPRYLPFLLTFPPYLWQVVQVQSRGEFVGQFGFKIGPHMLNNLIPYMAVLAFPWTVDLPKDAWMYVWLALVSIGYAGVMIWRKSLPMLFLALFAVLNISPLLGFPLDYFNTRYLYLSTISSAIVLASIFEIVWQRVASRRFLEIGVAILVAAVVVTSSSIVVASADGLAEYTRRIRVPFRDVTRLHPTFPPGTYLYFVNSPQTSYWDFEGLFFSRYGNEVKVNATDLGKPADLRAHPLAYVYYFDATGKPIELAVDLVMAARVTPTLPAQFENDMVLDAYEIPSARLQRGKALVVILNWHAQSKLQDDFTVFAHLIDAQGNRVAEYDSLLGNGKSPTSQWTPRLTFVDAVVLPLSPELPLGGGYRLEIGMYSSQTLQRVNWRDAAGNRNDRVIIDPFEVVDAP